MRRLGSRLLSLSRARAIGRKTDIKNRSDQTADQTKSEQIRHSAIQKRGKRRENRTNFQEQRERNSLV